MKSGFYLGIAAALGIAAPAIADDFERDASLRAAEAWMTKQMEIRLAPGATAALVHDQDVIWSAAYGAADVDAGVAMTPQTDFSVCSISKLFTSIGVMTLVEGGHIDLDAPLSTYLPDYALSGEARKGSGPVTVRDMLSHASGLPREPLQAGWLDRDFPTAAELRADLRANAADYEPGENFQYSNLAMSLLGEVIAAASGQSYDAYMRAAVLGPLGLDGVSTDLPMTAEADRSFARGYSMYDRAGQRTALPPYQLRGYAPAAGYAASVSDLARFASWQFRLLESGETEVLSRPALRDMHRVHWHDPFDPAGGTFGFGFAHSKMNDMPLIGHNGYCNGYRANFAMHPAKRIAVISMVNANDISPHDLSAGVLAIALPTLAAASEDGDKKASAARSFADYEGSYSVKDMPWGSYILPRGDGVIMIDLFADEPMKYPMKFVHIEGDTFRLKRPEGDMGARLTFDRDADGKVIGSTFEGVRMPKSG
ncbi:serine hydrolase [Pacificimonas sp. WHA3]|uniref:Serine hydrolase n=1 Tax=Pacificimonas pallii TaxID=2827236 RepID=A0ABS6SC19_9SPHN|nr:serine hydrolase [Pacificimonas pallii]MBV7255965.1 serine hydrolase [Pacificimonas pallii]